MIWKVAVLLSLVLGAGAVPIGVDDPEDGGKHWVVIVAGSNGWYNYRHQVRNPSVLATGFVSTKWCGHFGRQFCFNLMPGFPHLLAMVAFRTRPYSLFGSVLNLEWSWHHLPAHHNSKLGKCI